MFEDSDDDFLDLDLEFSGSGNWKPGSPSYDPSLSASPLVQENTEFPRSGNWDAGSPSYDPSPSASPQLQENTEFSSQSTEEGVGGSSQHSTEVSFICLLFTNHLIEIKSPISQFKK